MRRQACVCLTAQCLPAASGRQTHSYVTVGKLEGVNLTFKLQSTPLPETHNIMSPPPLTHVHTHTPHLNTQPFLLLLSYKQHPLQVLKNTESASEHTHWHTLHDTISCRHEPPELHLSFPPQQPGQKRTDPRSSTKNKIHLSRIITCAPRAGTNDVFKVFVQSNQQKTDVQQSFTSEELKHVFLINEWND